MTFTTIGEAADRVVARLRKKKRPVPKTTRRTGQQRILEHVSARWQTAPVIAMSYGRNRNTTGLLLLRALRKGGLVERRLVRCECCNARIYQWRRL